MSFIEIEKRQRILPCLPSILVMIIKNIIHKLPKTNLVSVFFTFARHGRALTGASPEHAQIVGSV